ncbi:MAG: hypothetical protein ICV83_04365 [Cytophagales bacterium]|nr:hypothetical protein [Cytophagales bacterium]
MIPLLRKASGWKALFAACACIFLLSQATSLAQVPMPGPTPGEENWQLIREVQGVKFYYQLSPCNGQSFLLFKAANGNAATVRGTWEIKVQHGERSRTLVGVLRPTPAGQAQAGSCERPSPDLAIPALDLDPAALQVSVTAKIISQ